MKVADLTGAELALWVARAQGLDTAYLRIFTGQSMPPDADAEAPLYAPHEDWAVGGPIIDEKAIAFAGEPGGADGNGQWLAYFSDGPDAWEGRGETHLISAMRAVVASVYGDTVPEATTLPGELPCP